MSLMNLRRCFIYVTWKGLECVVATPSTAVRPDFYFSLTFFQELYSVHQCLLRTHRSAVHRFQIKAGGVSVEGLIRLRLKMGCPGGWGGSGSDFLFVTNKANGTLVVCVDRLSWFNSSSHFRIIYRDTSGVNKQMLLVPVSRKQKQQNTCAPSSSVLMQQRTLGEQERPDIGSPA